MTVRGQRPTFALPQLSCPFPVSISPHAAVVQHGTEDWIRAHGVLPAAQMEPFTRAAYGELAARVYPYARLPLLQMCSDWLAWLFAIDDVVYEVDDLHAVASIPECLQVLTGDSPGRTGFGRALADVRARVAAVTAPAQLRRWVRATREYLLAQAWELATRAGDQAPSLESYVTMRRLTGAMATVFALIDIAAEAPVAAETWSDPAVRTIRQHAIDIVCWDNDLISWRKEATAANSVNNLVAVLVAAGLSTPQAVSRIVDMRNQAVVAVVALSQDLIARQQEHLTALVRGLQAWISGALAYSTHSTRYSAMPDL